MSMFRKKPFPEPPKRTKLLGADTEVRDSRPQPVQPVVPPDFLRDNELRTSLAADSVINGKLAFTTPTRIDGKLKGELRCTQLLVIGPTAIVEGWVRADTVRLEGVVRGEIAETRRVEIRPSGRFIGRLATDRLVLHEGAIMDGECLIGVPDPQQHPDEDEAEKDHASFLRSVER